MNSQWRVYLILLIGILWGGCSSPPSPGEDASTSPGAHTPPAPAPSPLLGGWVPAPPVMVPKPSCASRVGASTKAAWELFRKNHPFHHQTVAISKPFGQGCRTLLIAEPPPSITVRDLVDAGDGDLSVHEIFRHPIGHDGWVADVAFVLPPMTDEDLEDLIEALHVRLYRTAYKAFVTPIEAARSPMAGSLNVEVRPGDLKSWFLDGSRVLPLDGSPATTAAAVVDGGRGGVYLSEERGLVAWAIPKGTALDELAADARRFSLDSDLIVGAIGGRNGALVIGRERQVPVDLLPPLRFETLALLASAREDKLEQSYERNHPFAGRLPDGKDWAPIYLSANLVDTEYGSLLNITDQLLKSWSNAGLTRYEQFAYPRPSSWPFALPLPAHLRASQVVYNWNTNSVAGAARSGDHDVLFVGSTGALNVSYFPDDEVDENPTEAADTPFQRAERTARAYFASSGDPSLARAVQYTAMYQLFQFLNVHATAPEAPVDVSAAERVLVEAAGKMLEKRNGPSLLPTSAARRARLARLVASPRGAEDYLNGLLRQGVPRREVASIYEEFRAIYKDRKSVERLINAGAIQRAYSQAASGRPARWIRTPSVVISFNVGGLRGAQGGHDIRAKVTRFGSVSDLTRVWLKGAPQETVSAARALPEVLRLPSSIPPMAPRGLPSASAISAIAARRAPKITKAPSVVETSTAALVERADGVYRIRLAGTDEVVEVTSRAQVADLLTGKLAGGAKPKKPIVIELGDMTPDEARGMLRTMEVHMEAEALGLRKAGKNVDVRRILTNEYDFSRARIVGDPEYKVYVDKNVSAVAMRIEVPARSFAGRVLLGVKMFFKGLVPEGAVAALRKVMSSFVSRSSAQVRGDQLLLELRRELKAAGAEFDVYHLEMQLGDGVDDIYVTERQQEDEVNHGRAQRVPA